MAGRIRGDRHRQRALVSARPLQGEVPQRARGAAAQPAVPRRHRAPAGDEAAERAHRRQQPRRCGCSSRMDACTASACTSLPSRCSPSAPISSSMREDADRSRRSGSWSSGFRSPTWRRSTSASGIPRGCTGACRPISAATSRRSSRRSRRARSGSVSCSRWRVTAGSSRWAAGSAIIVPSIRKGSSRSRGRSRRSDIYDVIRRAEPLTDAVTFGFPSNVRRRYELPHALPEELPGPRRRALQLQSALRAGHERRDARRRRARRDPRALGVLRRSVAAVLQGGGTDHRRAVDDRRRRPTSRSRESPARSPPAPISSTGTSGRCTRPRRSIARCAGRSSTCRTSSPSRRRCSTLRRWRAWRRRACFQAPPPLRVCVPAARIPSLSASQRRSDRGSAPLRLLASERRPVRHDRDPDWLRSGRWPDRADLP